MRIIDADALKAEFDKNCAMECACCDHATCNHVRNAVGCGLVDAAPTIDAISVEWLEAHKTEYLEDWGIVPVAVGQALTMWQQEQEAR